MLYPPRFPPPPHSAAPSRTLLLSMVPASVSESTVRRELEVFGDVRSMQMERRREGLVTVHFYHVRASQAALVAIQDQHMQQQYRLGRHYEAVLDNGYDAANSAPSKTAWSPTHGKNYSALGAIKTKMCNNFKTKQGCKFGEKCSELIAAPNKEAL